MRYNIRGYVVLCISLLILFFGLKTLGLTNIIFETTSIMYFEYGVLGVYLIICFLILCNSMRKGEFVKTKKILSDKNEELKNVLNAINKSNAVIEFCPNGGIITANENFLDIMGYDISDVVGNKHSMFVNKQAVKSKKYIKFWDDLRLGKFKSGDFIRYTKLGEQVHIHGTYNPIFNKNGDIVKIMKIVTNITESVHQKLELEKKNTYLEHAAKILRHDMHSGINTYIPRGLRSLKRRLNDDLIKLLNIEAPLRLLEEGLAHTQKVYEGVKEFTNLVKKDSKLEISSHNLGVILKKHLKSTSYSDQVKIDKLIEKEVNKSLFCTAIDNLIRNGLKYNDSKSKFIVVYMEGDYLIVRDNGRGMSKQEFEEYSKPYTRKGGNKESGSGLGLNICIAIMNEHGFLVSCEKLKNGTKIKILL
jgi:PAS domain S-box-containing protein